MATVYRAINKPLLLLGIEKKMMATGVILSIVSFFVFGRSFRAAFLVAGTLYAVAKHLSKKDPHYLSLWWSMWRQKKKYDPILRNRKSVIIIHDKPR